MWDRLWLADFGDDSGVEQIAHLQHDVTRQIALGLIEVEQTQIWGGKQEVLEVGDPTGQTSIRIDSQLDDAGLTVASDDLRSLVEGASIANGAP